MILPCDKISNFALGPSTKLVLRSRCKGYRGVPGPQSLPPYILSVLALSLGQAPHLNSQSLKKKSFKNLFTFQVCSGNHENRTKQKLKFPSKHNAVQLKMMHSG